MKGAIYPLLAIIVIAFVIFVVREIYVYVDGSGWDRAERRAKWVVRTSTVGPYYSGDDLQFEIAVCLVARHWFQEKIIERKVTKSFPVDADDVEVNVAKLDAVRLAMRLNAP